MIELHELRDDKKIYEYLIRKEYINAEGVEYDDTFMFTRYSTLYSITENYEPLLNSNIYKAVDFIINNNAQRPPKSFQKPVNQIIDISTLLLGMYIVYTNLCEIIDMLNQIENEYEFKEFEKHYTDITSTNICEFWCLYEYANRYSPLLSSPLYKTIDKMIQYCLPYLTDKEGSELINPMVNLSASLLGMYISYMYLRDAVSMLNEIYEHPDTAERFEELYKKATKHNGALELERLNKVIDAYNSNPSPAFIYSNIIKKCKESAKLIKERNGDVVSIPVITYINDLVPKLNICPEGISSYVYRDSSNIIYYSQVFNDKLQTIIDSIDFY